MIQLVSIVSALSLLIFILYLIYHQKLKKQYSILWIVLSLAILLFSVWRNGLEQLADFLGVYYAPALLFMMAFLIVLVIMIHLSVVISSLKDQVRVLSQKLSLLEKK